MALIEVEYPYIESGFDVDDYDPEATNRERAKVLYLVEPLPDSEAAQPSADTLGTTARTIRGLGSSSLGLVAEGVGGARYYAQSI